MNHRPINPDLNAYRDYEAQQELIERQREAFETNRPSPLSIPDPREHHEAFLEMFRLENDE